MPPIPPLRLNKIMAWRQQGNPLSFFPGFTRKKEHGDLLSCHQDMILFSSCANTLIFNTNHNPHTETDGQNADGQSRKASIVCPKFFFPGFTGKKRRKGCPQLPPGHDSIQLLCKYLRKISIGALAALAYGHPTVAVECPRSRSNWCSQVFDTNPNPHTETYRRSDNLAHSN